jgi:hypothetical protein
VTDTITAYWFACEDEQGRAYSPNKPDEKWRIGQRRTLKGEIIPCQYGYHASPSLWDALRYAPGALACKVELSGTIVPHGDDKYAASTRKLVAAVNVERELRLFAADCAEHVLYLFEEKYPDDDRPRKAIQAARDFANGLITAANAAYAAYAAYAANAAVVANAANAAYAAANAYATNAAASYAAADAAHAAANAAYAINAAYAGRYAATNAAAAHAGRSAEKEWQREQFEQRFDHIFDEVQP